MIKTDYYAPDIVVNSKPKLRLNFVKKSFLNLSIFILAFLMLATITYRSSSFPIFVTIILINEYAPYILLIALILLSILINFMASKAESLVLQYIYLLTYIFLANIVFIPILSFISNFDASILFYLFTLILILSATIFYLSFLDQTDFSFVKNFLNLSAIIVLCSFVFTLFLSPSVYFWFSAGIILLIGTSMIYETNRIIYKYKTNQFASASLAMLSSIPMIFFHIIRYLLGSK